MRAGLTRRAVARVGYIADYAVFYLVWPAAALVKLYRAVARRVRRWFA